MKQSTVEQRNDELSLDENRKTDIKPGTLSASNKAVSLESISHCTTGTGISSGSSTTVSDSKTRTSSGLVRDAVGGSEKNISERTVRAPLSSSSFRLGREIKDSATVIITDTNTELFLFLAQVLLAMQHCHVNNIFIVQLKHNLCVCYSFVICC